MINKTDIVKYDNILNKLSLAKLEEKELELFFALCLELKNKGTDEVFINITEFKNHYSIGRSNVRLEKYLEVVLNKFLETKVIIKTDKKLQIGNFFRKFILDLENNILFVQVDNDYQFILNNLVKMYTQFSFKEYQSLNSKYSKRLMPKLCQWNSVRKIEFEKEDLFQILGASTTYRKDISNFNRRILNPTIVELKKVFNNLEVKTTKNINNSIKSYIFSWSNKEKIEKEIEIEEVKTLEISKKLKNLLDEAVKNPKLELLEKPSIIEYLLKHYSENVLILGIRQLLNSNIKTKIRTRKYLIEVLENINKKENIKIVLKEDKKVIENKKEIEEYKPIEKLEISQDEYNKLLDEELENYIQEAKDKNLQVNLEITKMSLKVKLNSKYKIKN